MEIRSRNARFYQWLQRRIMIGEINERTFVPSAYMNDSEFGRSWYWPLVLEIRVANNILLDPGGVGKRVKKRLFNSSDYKGIFYFNVNFSCAHHRLSEKSSYCDPLSHWFNVFYGYYQIDVPKSKWKRPFGYKENCEKPEPRGEDIIRIGKADWNYFSNYLYGVPERMILDHNCNSLSDNSVFTQGQHRIKIGEKYWDYSEIDNMSVITAYQAEKGKRVAGNSIFSRIWRDCFGLANPRENFPESFFPTRMKIASYTCFLERMDNDLKEEVYSTFIFGGSINLNFPEYATRKNRDLSKEKLQKEQKRLEAFNNRFLNKQLEVIRNLIADEYSDLGFNAP